MVAQRQVEFYAEHLSNAGDSRITVTELSDPAFGNVTEAYGHSGFDRGYQIAVTEMLGSLLPATEAFLLENPAASTEVRETLYRFERWLAHRLDAASRPEHWVEHGAGI
jgi:hypothetical protein